MPNQKNEQKTKTRRKTLKEEIWNSLAKLTACEKVE